MYVFTQHLHHQQDMIKLISLKWVQLIWIQFSFFETGSLTKD